MWNSTIVPVALFSLNVPDDALMTIGTVGAAIVAILKLLAVGVRTLYRVDVWISGGNAPDMLLKQTSSPAMSPWAAAEIAPLTIVHGIFATAAQLASRNKDEN